MVSRIDTARDIEETKTKLMEWPMLNNADSWNCQDWVMGVLEVFKDEELLESSTYEEAGTRLDGFYHEY